MVQNELRTNTDNGETLVNEDGIVSHLGSRPVGAAVTEALRESLVEEEECELEMVQMRL